MVTAVEKGRIQKERLIRSEKKGEGEQAAWLGIGETGRISSHTYKPTIFVGTIFHDSYLGENKAQHV
jgi:hypothetical protein